MRSSSLGGSALIHIEQHTIRYSRPEPAMSITARRIVLLSRHLARMQRVRLHDDELYLIRLQQDLAGIAAQYIAWATVDMDSLARESEAAAAGLRTEGPRAAGRGRAVASGGVTCL
ncbi:hypothetical protein [Paracidovorax konjaci]|uniref:Uncharacterized protein n=1 Tax=Paracidovorax konjaci TaxID=32040 RepID=A0A1I1ZMD0_9BURK|nr:hypothetical protein [Paracidovorax konjaci]SFE32856.1 hypothetical protein SAMN04489710_1318 [Paracidovorax konjaci]